jgi:DNA repair photolyase
MPRSIANPPNPWSRERTEWANDSIDTPPPLTKLEVFEETAKSILSENQSPDLSFRWSANPYRGCYHGCAYCYARPTHQYWGFGAGTDFDRKIIVKTNAAELLHEAFTAKGWKGEWLVLSGNTDCYQPLEASYRITRKMLETCVLFRQPVGIITKSSVIRRDIDVLAKLAREGRAKVTLSIAFEDDETGRLMEPFASPISKRFETMRMLSEAGIEVGISLAPIIPCLNESSVVNLLERAKENGASFAFLQLVRLSREVLPVFVERLEEAFPMRAEKVKNAIRAMRGGELNDASFGSRMRGEGERWKLVEQLFRMHTKRLGLRGGEEVIGDVRTTFERPKRQLTLFG